MAKAQKKKAVKKKAAGSPTAKRGAGKAERAQTGSGKAAAGRAGKAGREKAERGGKAGSGSPGAARGASTAREKLIAVRPSGSKDDSFFDLVHEVARQIPRGRVTSYGAIAASLGDTGAALLACERNLFPPSASAAVEADRDLKLCFGNNAAQSQLDLFTNNQPVKQIALQRGKERLMEGTAPRERNGIAIRRLGVCTRAC